MLKKMFSFYGTMNRKEYLLYGIIIPIIIFKIIFFSSIFTDKTIFASITLPIIILVFYIIFISVLKRIREITTTYIPLLLWFVIPPIIMIYILFMPSKNHK